MKQLVIVGSGAVAAEITAFIEDPQYGPSYDLNIKGYLDIDDSKMLQYEYKSPYLGRVEDYIIEDKDCFIIAIGNNKYRKENAEKISDKKGKFINFIHPTCIIANTARIGTGNIINPFTGIGPEAKVGDFNWISQSDISHDCHVGNFNFFSNASVCGNVRIGHENTFNVRSAVIPKINIGNNNLIQAGMVVNKNLGDNVTVFYRYKEHILAIPKEVGIK
ncbi:MAG: acetyltransferase [Bacteroidales bacterium]|jgi:sugar O-acyltransferase (sialic acid O-acetyltransferase NeuD family)|nr:acetyltransferase [Bacteroidales bacterium]